MCFSSEVSFISAAVIGTVGYYTMAEIQNRRQIYLALMPLLFALQQASEGVLWVFLKGQLEPNILYWFCEYLYMVFGYALWPVMFSLGTLMVEDVPWRKWVLSLCLLGGIAMSYYNLRQVLMSDGHLAIVDNSIRYLGTTRHEGLLYLLSVSLPFILSSVPGLWLLGVLAPISFGISAYVFWNNFASVWCLFAACLSIGLLFVVRAHSKAMRSLPATIQP